MGTDDDGLEFTFGTGEMSKALATAGGKNEVSEAAAKSVRESSISELPDGGDDDDDAKSTPEDERPPSLKAESDSRPPSSTQDPKNHTFTFGNSDTSAKMIQQAAAQFKIKSEEKYQIQTTTAVQPPTTSIGDLHPLDPHVIRPFYQSNVPEAPMSLPAAPYHSQNYDGFHTSWDSGAYSHPVYGQYGTGPAAYYEPPLPMMVPYTAPAPPPLPVSYGQRTSFDSRRSSHDRKYSCENSHNNDDPGGDKDSGRDWRCLIASDDDSPEKASLSPLEEVALDPADVYPSRQPCDTSEASEKDLDVPISADKPSEMPISRLGSDEFGGGMERENTLDTHMEELQGLSMELTRECQERRQQLQRDKIFQNELVNDINTLWKECVEVVGNDRLMAELDAQRHERYE
ncbi:hypothetical protein FOL47_002266 [Perkinsus chesapeaki]|uniref:Uncharacterized protein n=1 Tax=Perkinsus chesapeaki TaxID=330153 RepID=A0A7J6MEQ5_PERCH|nr:hypothetical protein FOL47_002266 [Perkinsus chesapeaki]